ncbi:MAG: 3-deoxy-manno-octulosonate cytidylyltransferase [Candidatus Omnitrophica bacterium]|nr:3-deoxy-manno-octulosonate cytidylyltransferase [Candidatus Omnitrophota bacterium]
MNTHKGLEVIGVIPARIGSERLARKVLREINGRILVEQVYRSAAACPLLKELWVATDSEEVLGACRQRKIPALLTSPDHASGTDRIYEVMTKKPAAIYVNIQGDEPLVRPEHLEALLKPFSTEKEVRVSTLKTKISDEAAKTPNVVKVVTDSHGWALYFSRSAIPFDRDGARRRTLFKHLGFYAYTKEALEKFHKLPPSSLEQAEKLEQLRFLENGVSIYVAETAFDTVGVDTEEDLKRAAALLAL